ncbi:hypothetical protein K1X76_06580 [bacterium]|nr:hypothetical protein [bacterium]
MTDDNFQEIDALERDGYIATIHKWVKENLLECVLSSGGAGECIARIFIHDYKREFDAINHLKELAIATIHKRRNYIDHGLFKYNGRYSYQIDQWKDLKIVRGIIMSGGGEENWRSNKEYQDENEVLMLIKEVKKEILNELNVRNK